MPATLRKACHACTTAKRRCIPQLPQCPRCLERGLVCTYELEPVKNTGNITNEAEITAKFNPPVVYHSPVFNSIAAAHQYSILSGESLRHTTQEGPLIANEETVALTVKHLKQIPILTFLGKTTAFAHTWILSAGEKQAFMIGRCGRMGADVTMDVPTLQELQGEQCRLLALDIHTLDFITFLRELHRLIALILALVLQAYAGVRLKPSLPDDLMGTFECWGKHFSSILPDRLDRHISPWHAWVIAESSRRTLLALPWVSGIFQAICTGFCSYRPFVEALPFDARTGLWEAESEEAWNAAMQTHDPSNGEASLVSWCEFIESGGAVARPKADGSLQRLLLVGYFGSETELPPELQRQDHPMFRTPNNQTGGWASER